MKSQKSKRFFINVVEYAVMNPKFEGFSVARIEVYDNHSKSPYAVYEGNVTMPIELFAKFRELIDFQEFDLPFRINFNMFDEKCFPDIYKKYYD